MDEGESRLEESFSAQGYIVLPRFLADDEIGALEARLPSGTRGLASSRALLELPWCLSLAQRIRSDPRLSSVWPAASRAALCTYFEKSRARIWLVALHQDLSIPVAERLEASGYAACSEKDGRVFVQPPLEVLEHSVAARVHLEASDEKTGALKVVPRAPTLSDGCVLKRPSLQDMSTASDPWPQADPRHHGPPLIGAFRAGSRRSL